MRRDKNALCSDESIGCPSQETSLYQPDTQPECDLAAGIKVIACNDKVTSLLSVNDQQVGQAWPVPSYASVLLDCQC